MELILVGTKLVFELSCYLLPLDSIPHTILDIVVVGGDGGGENHR